MLSLELLLKNLVSYNHKILITLLLLFECSMEMLFQFITSDTNTK